MKTFTVEAITTTDDGRVILSGPHGTIDICRVSEQASHVRHVRYHDEPEGWPRSSGCHRTAVDQIIVHRKGEPMPGSLAF